MNFTGHSTADMWFTLGYILIHAAWLGVIVVMVIRMTRARRKQEKPALKITLDGEGFDSGVKKMLDAVTTCHTLEVAPGANNTMHVLHMCINGIRYHFTRRRTGHSMRVSICHKNGDVIGATLWVYDYDGRPLERVEGVVCDADS